MRDYGGLLVMDTSDLSHHILSRYNADLEGVRTAVLQMGGLVEQQLQNGVKAVVSGDSRLGEEVARLDHKINAMEVAIDEDCSRILATRGPTASDLRLIVAVIKTITDLERIGDEAEKLGHAAARLASGDRSAERYRELKHIGELVAEMVHGALDAFARLDTDAALAVARRDRAIDEEYEAIQRQCITFMMEDPRAIRRTLDVLWIARALERIGDHAKNICEYVVYMALGKDIRHLSLDDVEQQLSEVRAARPRA
jgi:phosphate transport system protein